MNRRELRSLARDRIRDARALLAARRWAGAYHLTGYAVECGLKSCILHHLAKTGMIFKDRAYLKSLGDCWTHDIDRLAEIARLIEVKNIAFKANLNFRKYWSVAKDWNETSRYERKTRNDAEELFEAVTNEPDGVLAWIRNYW